MTFTATEPALATVVLAAGAGTRFHGTKQLALVEGKPLLARVLEALEPLESPKIVVLGAASDRVRSAVPQSGWEIVEATEWEAGQGASLRAGLAAVPSADSVLVVLGDLAWLRWEAVERVLSAAAAATDIDAFRAVEGDTPGHPLLLRGGLLELARHAPDEGLRPLLEDADLEPVDCTGLGAARDVDSREDVPG